ncbi:hypothetical protein BC831DRAFT_511969 [Entophlyctis helioformis]|nr:hypothetical protein BC831DRAFT_511969 [Entophlyctis helioformis]
MSTAVFEFLLPPPPAGWDANKESKVHKKIAQCLSRPVEPAGHAFMSRARRHVHNRTLEEDILIEEALRDAAGEDVSLEEDEPESAKLLKSDPANWKTQDHYAVLGLSKLRYAATDEDIKRAYRRKVLKHHPDKKAVNAATGKRDDQFFKCIQKANEVLSDNKKRREWDSCDPEFDDTIPSAKAKGDFFEIYAPVFASEARFSKKKPVVLLGTMDSTREEVDAFYNFWWGFESWRTFEMMDEEDVDSVEGREEKRYIDRKNRAARSKLKKEDNARLNRLVDQAYALDPRMKKFKEADKAAKEAKKRERELASKAGEIEAAKAKLAADKAKREQIKNAIRKEKKAIKRLLRDNNNFLPADASPDATIVQVERAEFILEKSELEHLESFRARLDEAFPAGVDALMLVFDEEHMATEEREADRKAAEAAAATGQAVPAAQESKVVKPKWSTKEISILIKAVKLFPGGASARWEKIAEYVNEHGNAEGETAEAKAARTRTPKECILESKSLQNAAASERTRLQMAATKPVAKVEITETPSTRDEPLPGEVAAASRPATAAAASRPASAPAAAAAAAAPSMPAPPNPNWSADQQLALEQALRKFPASAFTSAPADRWVKIAGEIPGKTTKDIKNRVKELADFVKNKKKK